MNIRPVGTESFPADGRTDKTLIVTFRNFANVPKNQSKMTKPKPRFEPDSSRIYAISKTTYNSKTLKYKFH